MKKEITFTILFNNVHFADTIKTSWGMSCYIEGSEKNILFDTGGDFKILLHNMEKLHVDPCSVDILAFSHIHADHTAGIEEILKINPDLTVFLLSSFPQNFKTSVLKSDAKMTEVIEPVALCKNVWSTGEMGESIKEQALIVNTRQGIVIVTGCAHPGIVHVVKKAHKLRPDKIYLVLGGFHLKASSEDKVKKIIKKLKQLGVINIGPSHCTGETPMQLFREAWGKNFLDLGAGAILKIEHWEEGLVISDR
ncbi:MBL fold metallo-hydrolase [candidate division CSSED10-310 bacterium]|uniref:MBL fold metallo-hydrolase n=1 Tax=candidate division CSSED10-310 bacterium TaxID=2855610 RepID=A0ABV6YY01_UNCC1